MSWKRRKWLLVFLAYWVSYVFLVPSEGVLMSSELPLFDTVVVMSFYPVWAVAYWLFDYIGVEEEVSLRYLFWRHRLGVGLLFGLSFSMFVVTRLNYYAVMSSSNPYYRYVLFFGAAFVIIPVVGSLGRMIGGLVERWVSVDKDEWEELSE